MNRVDTFGIVRETAFFHQPTKKTVIVTEEIAI